MKQQYEIALLFSAYRAENSDLVNADNHARAAEILESNKVTFKEVDGMFKGNLEQSFIVFGKRGCNYGWTLARRFGQESVILLNQDRDAILIDCKTEKQTELGKFKATDSIGAKKAIGWTFDSESQKYFVIE